VNILLIDEQFHYRNGLQSIIEMNIPSSTVYTADYQDLEQIINLDIDIVLLEPFIKSFHPIKVLKKVQHSFKASNIVILTMCKDIGFLSAFFQNNIRGIIDKSTKSIDITNAIKNVMIGNIFVSQNLAGSILEQVNIQRYTATERQEKSKPSLTKREWEILELLSRGFTNNQIAESLYITEGTAAVHISKLQKKLNVNNRVSAVMKAISNNWIDESVYQKDFIV
jgi:two-component system, NarL family, response regulator DegU